MDEQTYMEGQNAANRTDRIWALVGLANGRRAELVRLDDFMPSSGLKIWYVWFPLMWQYKPSGRAR